MFATRIYFSLSEIADPAKHRAHNEWHQLDHQPENFLLPGVVAGSRWVRSPDCAAAGVATGPGYAAAHYAIMYWFREPLADTLDEFFTLSERSFQWGRSPQIGFTRRPMRGFFVPVAGVAAPRIGLPPEALAFRPACGVHLTLSRLESRDGVTAEHVRRDDEARLASLLDCPGVAGAWSFAAEDLFRAPGEGPAPGAWPFADGAARAGATGPDRIQLVYLDEDPVAIAPTIAARGAGLGEVSFAGPLRSIVPWEWDWFERGGTTAR